MNLKAQQKKYYAETRRARRRENGRPERERIAKLRAMPYYKYLKTEHWRRKRIKALNFAQHRCQECGSTVGLQVHHTDYSVLGCEPIKSLRVLCSLHHVLTHREDVDLPSHDETVDEQYARLEL